jgi:CheY-like chemotaxis protein
LQGSLPRLILSEICPGRCLAEATGQLYTDIPVRQTVTVVMPAMLKNLPPVTIRESFRIGKTMTDDVAPRRKANVRAVRMCVSRGQQYESQGLASTNHCLEKDNPMSQLTNPVILVIDSDPITMAETAAALRAGGNDVHGVRSRESALQMAGLLVLDLIICDVNVSGCDGIALCKEIRSLPDRSDVPVLFVSTSQVPSIASRAFQNGSAYFLKKPIAPQLLIDLVEKALWMPHLIKSHVHRPHISFGTFSQEQSHSENVAR